jgi:dolichyl-phosphate-mannose-protein mannosyltransferase
MEIKEKLLRFYRWEHFWLCLIVLATLVMHFAIINRPPDIVFDEQHYIEDARNIVENHETLRAEHPPLGKLFLIAGMEIFGDNPVGWRFFPILFGTAIIVFFYFLCRGLGMGRTGSSIATFFLAFENMTFVHAGMAMLEVYFLAFMMGAFMLYVNRHWVASGAMIGLSGLAKLNGALALPTVIIHWFFSGERRSRWFALLVIMAPVVFLGWMILFDLAIVHGTTGLHDPIYRTKEMLDLSGTLKFATTEHEALSRPWEWLISYKPMAYWITPRYTGAISFTVWALTMPTFVYMVWRAIKKNSAALFGASWFFCNYILWIPASIITDRVSYIYYFYPAVGAICLGVGLALSQLMDIFRNRPSGKLKWTALVIVIIFILAHLVSFIGLSPVVPVDWLALLHIGS